VKPNVCKRIYTKNTVSRFLTRKGRYKKITFNIQAVLEVEDKKERLHIRACQLKFQEWVDGEYPAARINYFLREFVEMTLRGY
jgi:hypothetical protein